MTWFGIAALAGTICLAAAAPAAAREITVKMLDRGAGGSMVFEPPFVHAQPGDIVRFLPTSPGHNAETIAGMWPAGVEPVHGAFGKELAVPVKTPGVYGIKCLPHYGLGMVALIQVGDGPSANLAAARAVPQPGLAAQRMTALLAQAH